MKTTINSRQIALLSIGAMFIISIVLYPTLPEILPRQWGINGNVNSTWHKIYAVSILPLLAILIHGLTYLLPQFDPKRDQYDKFRPSYERIRLAVVVLLLGMHVLMLTQYENPNLSVKAILFGSSLLFAVIGNEMGRFRQTWFTGIRTPWTLADERVWKRTHRVGARWFFGVGILNMLLVFLLPLPVFTVVFIMSVFGVALGTIMYSYVLYRRYNP